VPAITQHDTKATETVQISGKGDQDEKRRPYFEEHRKKQQKTIAVGVWFDANCVVLDWVQQSASRADRYTHVFPTNSHANPIGRRDQG